MELGTHEGAGADHVDHVRDENKGSGEESQKSRTRISVEISARQMTILTELVGDNQFVTVSDAVRAGIDVLGERNMFRNFAQKVSGLEERLTEMNERLESTLIGDAIPAFTPGALMEAARGAAEMQLGASGISSQTDTETVGEGHQTKFRVTSKR